MSLSTCIYVGIATLVAALVVKRATEASREGRNGCKVPQKYPHWEPILGLDLKIREVKDSLSFRRLPLTANLFCKIGRTFKVNNVGGSMIRTIDPENVHAVQTSNERDWAIEPLRLYVMEPFCGRGFITTDGVVWKRSRAMLKPSFNNINISQSFQASVDDLIELIPQDGSTVDLAELFSIMV